MPVNREPHIYQGYVISMIGQNRGQPEDMEFANAQACVMSGTHRWADDPTDLPNGVRVELARREAEDAASREADRIHNEEMRRQREAATVESVQAALYAKARPFAITKEDGKLYLASPFPDISAFSKELLDDDESGIVSIIEGTDGEVVEGDIVMTFENAMARYRPVGEYRGDVIAELVESMQPDVDIPDNWRELGHRQTIPLAKAIRGTSGSMKKADAEAILEKWTNVYDPVPVDAPAEEVQPKPGEGPEAGNRDQKPFSQDADGNPLTAEEKAALDAQRFAAGDDDF